MKRFGIINFLLASFFFILIFNLLKRYVFILFNSQNFDDLIRDKYIRFETILKHDLRKKNKKKKKLKPKFQFLYLDK